MHQSVLIASFLFLAAFFSREKNTQPAIAPDTPVETVLERLGAEAPGHTLNPGMEGATAQRGYELLTMGKTSKPGGGTVSKQSRHFVCTSCHNMKREDPDLSVSDPQARLDYAYERGMPFLQGTSLYGVVNRRSFYNDDYVEKYGEEGVAKARHDLREAIQLCAVGCAQGRAMDDWEIESVLAYFWTIGYKMSDLGLTDSQMDKLNMALDKGADKDEMLELIKSKYLQASPATFTAPPEDRKAGYGLTGDPDNGKKVYDLSCMHCHENGRYSFYYLNDSKITFNHLDYHMARYSRYSLYQVARYGTSPLYGKKSYMPQYTQERLSDQQMEDLRAYIELEAKG
jgi:mono/diheme cytochrome c family protein